jgi:hypothetical protein
MDLDYGEISFIQHDLRSKTLGEDMFSFATNIFMEGPTYAAEAILNHPNMKNGCIKIPPSKSQYLHRVNHTRPHAHNKLLIFMRCEVKMALHENSITHRHLLPRLH